MPIFMLNGMVTDCSAEPAGPPRSWLHYVGIQDPEGRRTRLKNVSAAPELAALLRIGVTGRFFFRGAGSSHRLVGFERADGLQAFDLQDPTVGKLNDYVERACNGAEDAASPRGRPPLAVGRQ
jgi:hypothetical protein